MKKYNKMVEHEQYIDDDDDFILYKGSNLDEQDDQDDQEGNLYKNHNVSDYVGPIDNMDDMEYLLYLLRMMFKGEGIDVTVTNDDLDVYVMINIGYRSKFNDLVKIFDVARKLKNDTMVGYSSTFEFTESKIGLDVLKFNFIYSEDIDI